MQLIYNSGLNEYALYLDCYGGDGSVTQRYRTDMKMLFQSLRDPVRQRILNNKVRKIFDITFGAEKMEFKPNLRRNTILNYTKHILIRRFDL